MSSPNNNSTSSSSTQSSLPAGATTGANNLNREETATTSTQQPNSVADPLHCHHHDPDAEAVMLGPRKYLEAGTCVLCGEEFRRERDRDFRRRPHCIRYAEFLRTRTTETVCFVCDACGIGFTSEQDRDLHGREHFNGATTEGEVENATASKML